MKIVLFRLCISLFLLLLIVIIVRFYLKYIKVDTSQIITQKIDTFIENIEEIVLTDEEYYSLGEIYHYGKFGKKIDKSLAIENYTNCIKKSTNSELIGSCYLQLARLYEEQEDRVNIDIVIHNYLKALEYGYEEAILSIGKIYMNGIHPSYLPDKMIAGRLFTTFINFSDTIKPWCKLHLQDIHSLNYNDLDAIKQYGVVYRSLPHGIVDRIQYVVNHMKVDRIVPYKMVFESGWLKKYEDNEKEDDIRKVIVKLPKQRIMNDRQNVHDHSVQNIGNEILNELDKNEINKSFEENVEELIKFCDKKTYPNVQRVVQSLTDLNHSKFDRSEKDVFNSVWSKVKDDDDKKQIFLDNLNSGVEYDTVVCSTGKIMLMLSTFDGVDDSLPDLKPDWVIKDEISQVIAKTISDLSDRERKEYESDDDERIKDVIHKRVKSKCNKDYQGVVEQDILDTYTDGLLEYI